MRAEARGGCGEGILGWHRRAISAYTWCVTDKGPLTDKGPQRKWLHKIGKEDTPDCRCNQSQQTGEHLVAGCSFLAEARKTVERKEMNEWGTL